MEEVAKASPFFSRTAQPWYSRDWVTDGFRPIAPPNPDDDQSQSGRPPIRQEGFTISSAGWVAEDGACQGSARHLE